MMPLKPKTLDMLEAMYQVFQADTPDDCVRVQIQFTVAGATVEYEMRTAESLRIDGISMRNIRGEFIK